MDDTGTPNLLLDLPAELRNRVYELVFSNCPDIKIGGYISRRRDRRQLASALSLTRVNSQLYGEAFPFYWHLTPVHIRHPSKREWSASDEKFYLWINNILKDSVKHCRRLKFEVMVPGALPCKSPSTPPEITTVSVDLTLANIEDAVKLEGWYSKHQNLPILFLVRETVAKIPRVDKKPVVTTDVLWDIYETFYSFEKPDIQRRSLHEFTRAYELNASKPRPKRWSEKTFYQMSQELLHGPNWRAEERKKKRRKKKIPSD